MRTLWLARRGLVAAFTLGAFLVLAGATGATTGALPGGTSIGVAISTPVEGSTLPLGPAVSLTGTAEVGTALPVANTLLMYVIDVSGSTSSVQATSVCGNQSVYDQSANTTLDCELLAVRDLNATAISNGTVAKVGIIGFGGSVSVGAATDAQILAMTGAGDNLIAPSANVTTPPFGFPFWVPAPTNNVQRVLASAYTAAAPLSQPAGWPFYTNDAGFMLFAPKEFPGNTNYWAALEKIRTLAQSSSLPNKMAIFLSDGASTVGGPSNQRANATTQLAGTGVKVFTFAVGPSASCSPAVSNFGTLEEISIATGAGHCVPLPNPANAVSAIPAVIASQLTDVKVAIDGAAATLQATTPATPRKGPDSVSFSSSIPGLGAGAHTICVNADGSDGGGTGTVQTCTHFTIQAPPTVSAGATGGTTAEGTPFALAGSASGGDTSWAAAGGTGTCSFSDPTSLTSSVTCTDDGTYTLTLTANDHVNPPVSATTTLAVTNVDPTATLTLSPGPHPLADAVSADVAISDPGADTFTCSLDWGDGTVAAGSVSGNACHGSHTYGSGGTRTVGATVTDDDGGVGTDSSSVTVDSPPAIILPPTPPSGVEGSTIPISATTNDDGSTTSHWSVVSDAGNDAGADCTVADPSSLSTNATCNDDGTFTLTLAVDDGVNPTVTSQETLTVTNAAPQVGHGVVSAGPHPQGQPVTVSWSFTDAGSNDTQTCSIDWGDGSPVATGVITGGTCTGAHSFASGGSFNSIATITDDDGGSGSDGVTIAVDAPPNVSAGGDVTGNEGALITLNGLVNDDHGATSVWTATPGAGVDAGATCTFGNALSAVTTVSCTDDGAWTLTLTGNDGVNPPVSSSATLTLANAAPTVHITNAGVSGGSTVTLTAAIADAGANDALTCSIDWGDGTTSVVTAVAGVCTASHTYSGSGQRTITVTGSDDDGGTSAPASTTVTLNHAPSCTAVTTSLATLWPPDGKFVLVTLSGATDVDGDALAFTINGVTQDEPVAGQPDAQRVGGARLLLRAQRDGTGDGRVYIVSYSVSDGHLTCAGTVRVTVVHDQAHAAVLSPHSYNSFG